MSGGKLSDNDRKLLALAWQCFETQPKINYARLAELGNYKNTASAASAFGATKRKLLACVSDDTGKGDHDGSNSAQASPRPKSKKRSRKAAKDETPPGDSSDDLLFKDEPAPVRAVKLKLEHADEDHYGAVDDDDDNAADAPSPASSWVPMNGKAKQGRISPLPDDDSEDEI